MPVARLRQTVFAGKTRCFRVQVVTESTGEPVGSLSGYTFTCTGKSDRDDGDGSAVFSLSLGDGIEVVDNVDSWIEVMIPGSATDQYAGTTTRLSIDVQTTDPDDNTWALADGTLTVKTPVRRAS